MTITPFEIYLISIADSLIHATLVIMGLAGMMFILSAMAFDMSCEKEEKENAKAKLKKSAMVFLVSLLILAAIPNSKTIAAMYLVPAVVNNEHIQNSAGNALGMLEELTKQWLRNLTKDSKQETNI